MKKNSDIDHSKNITGISIVICLLVTMLVIFVFCVTFAIFTFSKQGDKRNSISTGVLAFSYTESTNGVYLTNAMPITDEVGKKLGENGGRGYFDFNISSTITNSTSIFYEIFATPINVDNPLSWEYVKLYLTDATDDSPVPGYTSRIPTFKELYNSEYAINSKRLYYGVFTKSESRNFRLRLWLASNYEVTNEERMFKIKVGVKAST